MNLSQLQPKTARKNRRRVGRGGKRGTYSGKGVKGQKSRAGAGVKPGFRGGDNRIWQLFPKQRGASKKPGGLRHYAKHRFFRLRHPQPEAVNLEILNKLSEGEITPEVLLKAGLVETIKNGVKILGKGKLDKKFRFSGFMFSGSARDKVIKSGGTIVSQ